jgi:hypothetical protein
MEERLMNKLRAEWHASQQKIRVIEEALDGFLEGDSDLQQFEELLVLVKMHQEIIQEAMVLLAARIIDRN